MKKNHITFINVFFLEDVKDAVVFSICVHSTPNKKLRKCLYGLRIKGYTNFSMENPNI
jgi:hypothetical protein